MHAADPLKFLLTLVHPAVLQRAELLNWYGHWPWLTMHALSCTAKARMVSEPLSSSFQVCWEKFCEYWDVEGRYVPVTKDYPVRQVPRGDSMRIAQLCVMSPALTEKQSGQQGPDQSMRKTQAFAGHEP